MADTNVTGRPPEDTARPLSREYVRFTVDVHQLTDGVRVVVDAGDEGTTQVDADGVDAALVRVVPYMVAVATVDE